MENKSRKPDPADLKLGQRREDTQAPTSKAEETPEEKWNPFEFYYLPEDLDPRNFPGWTPADPERQMEMEEILGLD